MKKSTGITIDNELWQMVKESEELNLSGLVNRLLWSYFSGGHDLSEAALEVRTEILEQERRQHEQRINEINAVLKSDEKRLEEVRARESDLDRELRRFVTDGGKIKALTGLNYKHFRDAYGLSKNDVKEKLEELSES